MAKLAPISQADLLRFMLSPQGLDDITAELLGYERKRNESAPSSSMFSTATALDSENDEEPDDPEIEFPARQPHHQFLMPVRATTLKSESPELNIGNPISDAELSVPWQTRGLQLQPLIPWSRLAPFVRNRLVTRVTGRRIDGRKLVRLISSGQPLTELPRLKRTAWAPHAVILCDDTPEMFPFRQDLRWLLDRLDRERGSGGLSVITMKDVPRVADVAHILPGTPLLVISAMGQLNGSISTQSAWLKLNRWLSKKEHIFHALIPCPQDRWKPKSVGHWSAVVWDRGQRLPRNGGVSARSRVEPAQHVADCLLDLLAPASLIEPPLLRAARLLQGRPADVGTEWDTWYHADCWQSVGSFGFEPGANYDHRLQRRSNFARGHSAALVAEIGDIIQEHHATCSPTIAAEAELRVCLSGSSDAKVIQKVNGLMQRVVDRLRLLAIQPSSDEGEVSGLSAWFVGMVDRLSATMRDESTIAELIARGLALAHTWQRADSELIPKGVNAKVYAEESRLAAMRVPDVASPVDYIVGIDESGISFVPVDQQAKPALPIGRIRSADQGRLQVDIGEPTSAHHSLQLGSDIRSGIRLDSMPTNLIVESTHSRLEFEAIDVGRLPWADRVWYDQYGIAAEFSVRNVPFVLRWIPPGRFLMGAPESELGRDDEEGPQHEVTISHGFWLGETPVTQEQWAASVEAGQELPDLSKRVVPQEELIPAPSRFCDSADSAKRPVEQINWHAASAFCQILERLMVEPPGFRLPTEGEWEYACRAGTRSAFNNGSACTDPDGHDRALDQLGWFDENSDKTTHPVRKKHPNEWGLYDMHGNVWEWCADGWSEDAYKTRTDGVVDPFISHRDSANRVMRGGSWDFQNRYCRASFRDSGRPAHDWNSVGLRLFAGQEPRGAERPNVP